MIGTNTSEALYTVIKNNTDKRILLTAYGTMKNGNIAPKGCIACAGYLFAGVPVQRMSNVYTTIKNGSISIYLIVRTNEGYKALELSADTTFKFTDADAERLYSTAQPTVAAAATTQAPARSVQRSITRNDDGFTVVAGGKTNKVAEMLGAKVADEQPAKHAPLNTDLSDTYGASKIASGNTDAIKAAARAQNEQPTEVVAEVPTEESAKMTRGELAEAVAACFADKNWERLMTLLSAEWPGIEFNKNSVKRLGSLEGIMTKYELV